MSGLLRSRAARTRPAKDRGVLSERKAHDCLNKILIPLEFASELGQSDCSEQGVQLGVVDV